MTSYLHDDGSLILAEWAKRMKPTVGGEPVYPDFDLMAVELGERETPMYGTPATGQALVSNGFLGVDLIRVPAGGGFAPHTHPGDHLLIVVAGEGTITYEGRIYPTRAGQVYMVEGAVPHAVGAVTDHCILAVGAPHRQVDAADRMELVAYQAVASDLGRLNCLACGITDTSENLRAQGCIHAPTQVEGARPLVVGIAPASPDHVGKPAFVDTRSGTRLAGLFGVPPRELLEVAETINLVGDYLPDWQSVPLDDFRKAAKWLVPSLGGRVVIACGHMVAQALGGRKEPWASSQVVGDFLLVTIPHPSGLSRSWNDKETEERARRALRLARTLAQTGGATGSWTDADADALNRAIWAPAT